MKLSEAILKGCTMLEPTIDSLFRWDGRALKSACALGAALVGTVGLEEANRLWELGPDETTDRLYELYPVLTAAQSPMTEAWSAFVGCRSCYRGLSSQIALMNDEVRKTREQIAADLAEEGL